MGDWRSPPATTSPRAARWPGSSLRRGYCVHVLKRICVASVSVLILSGLYFFYSPGGFAPDPDPYGGGAVTILIWTHPFLVYEPLPDCSEQFGIDGCVLTDDARQYRQVEAVLVHHREISSGAAALPPEPRPSAQKWIWMNYESPTHTRRTWLVDGAFNLTMSYRTDSDIFLPYGYLVPQGRSRAAGRAGTGALSRPSRPRRRFVAWVISNWSETHARVAFYYQLRRYIRIDVFGRAGRPLPKGAGSVVRVLGEYQLYLALENSLHRDYITEKLWNAVRAGAVPVVMGPPRANYERFLPPEAFIHVDDFPSVKQLARYLLALRRQPARIRRHLEWRRGYSLQQPDFWGQHYCTACRAVRRARGKTDVVRDLPRWFES